MRNLAGFVLNPIPLTSFRVYKPLEALAPNLIAGCDESY